MDKIFFCCNKKVKVKKKKTQMPRTHQIPRMYCCYVCYLLTELFLFEAICLFLIVDRYTNALGFPYDPYTSTELVLYLVILMIMQLFIFIYSILSICNENQPLLVFGLFAQCISIVRATLLFLNYFYSIYYLPMLFQLLTICPHLLCGWLSCLNYGFKKFDTVNNPKDQRRYNNWKNVEALLYLDMLTSFCVIILGLFMIDYSVQFYLGGAVYLICSLVLIICYIRWWYHEQWKCCTIIYIFCQVYLVLYLVYKFITIMSGFQSDEMAPIWDDNEYWHLFWVSFNLGTAGLSATIIRSISFLWLIFTMAKYFDKKLTVAYWNRPPKPGPHWYLVFAILWIIHRSAVLYNLVCCRPAKCSCCGMSNIDGSFAIWEFIRDLRGAKTLEEELELLGESGGQDKKVKLKKGWGGVWQKTRYCIGHPCDGTRKVYQRITGKKGDEEDDEIDRLYDEDDDVGDEDGMKKGMKDGDEYEDGEDEEYSEDGEIEMEYTSDDSSSDEKRRKKKKKKKLEVVERNLNGELVKDYAVERWKIFGGWVKGGVKNYIDKKVKKNKGDEDEDSDEDEGEGKDSDDVADRKATNEFQAALSKKLGGIPVVGRFVKKKKEEIGEEEEEEKEGQQVEVEEVEGEGEEEEEAEGIKGKIKKGLEKLVPKSGVVKKIVDKFKKKKDGEEEEEEEEEVQGGNKE